MPSGHFPTKYRSLPVRGAWIEITLTGFTTVQHPSLPVRGAWIEMLKTWGKTISQTGRSPCGERGLKSVLKKQWKPPLLSLPVRGAWIEIVEPLEVLFAEFVVAPRAGSVD